MKVQNRDELTHQLIARAQEDAVFKKTLLSDPKSALNDLFGMTIDESTDITVLEETPTKRYIVIPADIEIPEDEELSDEALEMVAGGMANCKFPGM